MTYCFQFWTCGMHFAGKQLAALGLMISSIKLLQERAVNHRRTKKTAMKQCSKKKTTQMRIIRKTACRICSFMLFQQFSCKGCKIWCTKKSPALCRAKSLHFYFILTVSKRSFGHIVRCGLPLKNPSERQGPFYGGCRRISSRIRALKLVFSRTICILGEIFHRRISFWKSARKAFRQWSDVAI